MIKQDGEKVRVQVVLTKEIREFAEQQARDNGLNVSAYIRMIIMQEKARIEKWPH